VFSLHILIGGEFRIIDGEQIWPRVRRSPVGSVPENPVYLAEKKVYYVFLFLKVSQCKLKQKETILKLGNPLKSKSKFTISKIDLGEFQDLLDH
jgi:hypothetical protein